MYIISSSSSSIIIIIIIIIIIDTTLGFHLDIWLHIMRMKYINFL